MVELLEIDHRYFQRTCHGAKTVSAGHLRASIMGNEKFDFLKDVVEVQIFLRQSQALGSQRMLLLAEK